MKISRRMMKLKDAGSDWVQDMSFYEDRLKY